MLSTFLCVLFVVIMSIWIMTGSCNKEPFCVRVLFSEVLYECHLLMKTEAFCDPSIKDLSIWAVCVYLNKCMFFYNKIQNTDGCGFCMCSLGKK